MTRWLSPLVAVALSLGAVACDDDDGTDPAAAPLWDATWAFSATSIETAPTATLPLPTDFSFLRRLADSGFPVGDVLEGAVATFEIDGRLLVQVAGGDAPEDLAALYHVLDGTRLELSVHRSRWFLHQYSFDRASETLLVTSGPDAGPAVGAFVFDVIEETLRTGSLESAAARVDALLFDDPRVAGASDAFLYAALHGELESVPIRDTADGAAWLGGALRQARLVGTARSDDELESALAPIVSDALAREREGLSRAVIEALLDSGALSDELSEERLGRVLRFELYRLALESDPDLTGMGRVDLLFYGIKPPSAW